MRRKTATARDRSLAFAALNAEGRIGTGRGYSIEGAYAVAGGRGVIDLDGGGYAIPVGDRPKKIGPPSKTQPILARIPSGLVWVLPGAYAWRIVEGTASRGSRGSRAKR